jgi:hypothetical protein
MEDAIAAIQGLISSRSYWRVLMMISLFHKDGLAPRGEVGYARNEKQRMAGMVARLR